MTEKGEIPEVGGLFRTNKNLFIARDALGQYEGHFPHDRVMPKGTLVTVLRATPAEMIANVYWLLMTPWGHKTFYSTPVGQMNAACVNPAYLWQETRREFYTLFERVDPEDNP